jgi:hypothetical protein
MLERVGPVVAAVVILAGLAVLLPDTDRDPFVPAAPQIPFLAAYERSRTVEAVVESTFIRTFPDGRELSYTQRLVQRPPDDRLVIGAGSAAGRIDGRVVRCSADEEGGPPSCLQGAEATPYDEEVAGEVRAMASLVDRDTGVYELTDAGGGCFALELTAEVLSPPYGTSASFCFDATTGVLAAVEVVRDEATDRTEVDRIRTEVTDADLRATDIGEPVATG